jgi:hypothetical protein
MGKPLEQLSEELQEFIGRQKVFFVGTAPLAAEGHINVSPKGLDSLRVLNSRTVAYLDLYGSGIETIAHLKQNSRITIMLCAVEGAPRIVRLYGRGRVAQSGEEEFQRLRPLFPAMPGDRSMIVVDLTRVADSCGFAVPLYEFAGHRAQLLASAEKKGPAGVAEYCRKNNAKSIDGLPGLNVNLSE